MRPIFFVPCSVNHRAPSGPTVISAGWLPAVRRYSVKLPPVVTLPIKSPPRSLNHRLPSGPATMYRGSIPFGTTNVVIVPAPGFMRAIVRPPSLANQRLLSGPSVIPSGRSSAPGGTTKSVLARAEKQQNNAITALTREVCFKGVRPDLPGPRKKIIL